MWPHREVAELEEALDRLEFSEGDPGYERSLLVGQAARECADVANFANFAMMVALQRHAVRRAVAKGDRRSRRDRLVVRGGGLSARYTTGSIAPPSSCSAARTNDSS